MSTPLRRQWGRRSYVIIAAITLVISVVALVWSSRLADQAQAQNAQTRQELCGVIGPFAQTPVSKTASAAYAYHERFVKISQEFHC